MKKIAFVIPLLAPYRITFYKKLIEKSGNTFLILYTDKKKEDGRPQYSGSGSLDIPVSPIEEVEIKLWRYTICYQKGVISKILRYKPHVILFQGNPGIVSNWLIVFISKILGIRLIAWVCAWERQRRDSLTLRFKQFFMSLLYKMVDMNLLYSSKAYDYLKRLGVNKSKMEIVFNGIDIEQLLKNEEEILCRALLLRKQYISEEKLLFVYVGGLFDEKKVDLLLNAFADIAKESKNLILWIVGDGPDRKKLEELKSKLSLENVKFWGRIIEESDIYFAAGDVFILPGVGGLALNQALFWRKPCIVSEADGTEEDLVIEGKTGFRFEKDNADSLKSAMKRFVNTDKRQRVEMGEAGREIIIQRSNVDAMVESFKKNIHKLL